MYMKRILTILAAVAMVMTAASCDPEQTPSLSFGKSHYVLLADAPLTIDVVTNIAPASDLTVELAFAGTAVMDEEYSVSATSVVIPAGQLKGSVTISPENNFEAEKVISISMTLPVGYEAGKYASTVVAVESRPSLVYSFYTAKSDVVGSYQVILELEDLLDDSWKASEEMQIPYTMTPVDGASASDIVVDSEYFTVPAGEYKGYLTVHPGETCNNSKFTIAITDPTLAAGENETMTLTVKGLLELSSLVGTWEFEEVLDLDEIEMWFMEMEDDTELLPTHNEGFKLTVSESNGTYTITPSGDGDWMNYFRTATIAHTAPMNMCAKGVVTGDYTSSEQQMFVAEAEGIVTSELTYFSLSSVNRAFDAESEELGAGVIAISTDDEGKLIIHIKDYDQPPFGEMMWDPGYDPELFAFASRFTKVTE